MLKPANPISPSIKTIPAAPPPGVSIVASTSLRRAGAVGVTPAPRFGSVSVSVQLTIAAMRRKWAATSHGGHVATPSRPTPSSAGPNASPNVDQNRTSRTMLRHGADWCEIGDHRPPCRRRTRSSPMPVTKREHEPGERVDEAVRDRHRHGTRRHHRRTSRRRPYGSPMRPCVGQQHGATANEPDT